MEKWEYKTIQIDPKKNPDTANMSMVFNQQGSLGWELVSCFTLSSTGEIVAVFKRKAGSPAEFEEKPHGSRGKKFASQERGSAPGKRFRYDGEQTPAFGESSFGEKPRSYGDKPRTYGKGTGYKEKGTGYKAKASGPKEKNSGYAGKFFGDSGKESGFTGKSAGHSRKGSGTAKGPKSKIKGR